MRPVVLPTPLLYARCENVGEGGSACGAAVPRACGSASYALWCQKVAVRALPAWVGV